jgi:hypothetical protein
MVSFWPGDVGVVARLSRGDGVVVIAIVGVAAISAAG